MPLNPAAHAVSSAPGAQTLGEMIRSIPAWVHIVGGGVVAAIVGAMMGGALHI
ncbi:hypothetical protein BH10PSE2_BH10PSE2_06010 [soil metagenome]